MPEKLFVLSGCSGGGKSTLLEALSARGFATIPEPGRRIVAEEPAVGGGALPWVNLSAFTERAVAMAKADLHTAKRLPGPVFFDRGLVDAATALAHAGGPPLKKTLPPGRIYARTVFLAPPWPEIYCRDAERQHDFREAKAEFHRLEDAFPELGYEVTLLPKIAVPDRAAFVIETLAKAEPR